MFQSHILDPPSAVEIDDTHDMVYQPCLFLECSKCLLSVSANAAELAEGCTEDIHELNNNKISNPFQHRKTSS